MGYSQVLQEMNQTIIHENENRNQIQIGQGAELVIKLPASPGTGYSWKVSQEQPNILNLMGKPAFVPLDEEKKDVIGAPAYQVFRFKAHSKGTVHLELIYKRQWEQKTKPEKVFSIIVITE